MDKIFFVNVLIALSALNLLGCSTFNNNPNIKDQGFYERATPARYAVPLPVEIARDIESISRDGMLRLKPGTIQVQGAVLTPEQQANVNASRNQMQEGRSFEQGQVNEQVAVTTSNGQRRTVSSNKRRYKRKKKAQAYGEEVFLLSRGQGPLMRSKRGMASGPLKLKRPGGGYYKANKTKLTGGKTISYIVKLGDTLMKIAFEKYGNYLRWKDIYQVNSHKMKSPRKMQVGTELMIENVKYVYIKKDGNPYLIKKEDTLKSISKKLYGTSDRWKDIWRNNPQLIKNPKKIYAGFTLYYNPASNESGLIRVPAKEEAQ